MKGKALTLTRLPTRLKTTIADHY